MTTEAFAQQLLSEAPLTKNGAYVPQSQQYLSELGPRIWETLSCLLQPFSSKDSQTFTMLSLILPRWLQDDSCLTSQIHLAMCGREKWRLSRSALLQKNGATMSPCNADKGVFILCSWREAGAGIHACAALGRRLQGECAAGCSPL